MITYILRIPPAASRWAKGLIKGFPSWREQDRQKSREAARFKLLVNIMCHSPFHLKSYKPPLN